MAPSCGLSAKSATALSGRLNVARECALLLLGLRRRYKVQFQSMTPTLNPGDYLLVKTAAYCRRKPERGELVLAQHPQDPSLVIAKRVGSVQGDQVMLCSDNAAQGQDSRHFGSIDHSQLLGQVTAIIA